MKKETYSKFNTLWIYDVKPFGLYKRKPWFRKNTKRYYPFKYNPEVILDISL